MPRRKPLSPALIVEDALALIDAVGIQAFSMRRLAERLKVDPMSLYHHIPSKEAVLDGVVDHLMREADLPTSRISWQEWVRTSGSRFFDLSRAHPRAFPLFVLRGLSSTESFRPLEAHADALIRGGFEPAETWELVQMFARYAVSLALDAPRDVLAGAAIPPAHITADQIPAEEFPRFHEVDTSGTDGRRVFERGLESMIAGLESELRRRRRARAGRRR